jgi:ABC-type transporter Mla subunit MlaD
MRLTPRLRSIIAGLSALVLLAGGTTIGVKIAFGYYSQGYELHADFDMAGQGLIAHSDVKIRGVNVGHVQSIKLHDGRAEITLFIKDGVDVPTSTVAVIRPKTLFGEKFVDLVPGHFEGTDDGGELYHGGDDMTACAPTDLEAALPTTAEGQPTVPADHAGCTVSSVELETVLAAAYPILEAVNPDDLQTILNELATAADGLGETINRSIVNGAALLDVQAANDANTRRFLEALANLSGELADRADDLISGSRDLNVALPVLNEHSDEFTGLLSELERLSNDASGILENNAAFIDAVYTDGQATLDTLYDNRSQLIPLVIGLRQFAQTFSSSARIPLGDGSVMAAVKGLLGGQVCGILPCLGAGTPASAAAGDTATTAPPTTAGGTTPPNPTDLLGILNGEVSSGTQAILDLLTGLLGGGGGGR